MLPNKPPLCAGLLRTAPQNPTLIFSDPRPRASPHQADYTTSRTLHEQFRKMDHSGTKIMIVNSEKSGGPSKRTYDESELDQNDGILPPEQNPRPTTPVPTHAPIHRCFRILGIPLSRTEDQVMAIVQRSRGLVRSDTDSLKLFPAVDGSQSQVGIISLEGPRNVIADFAPNDHDNSKKTMCEDNHITVDRFFYGITPLNVLDRPVAECVNPWELKWWLDRWKNLTV